MNVSSSIVPTPVVLVVLDGFGISAAERGNAVAQARKPALEHIEAHFPFTTLQASGAAVGLPWGEAGNSEVGHLTMGAGRVIYHHLPRIIVSIRDGSFFENPAFAEVIAKVKANASALHLIGLVSSGSVHSYLDHLTALLELVTRAKIAPLFLHVITDGKDAPPQEGRAFLEKFSEHMRSHAPTVTIASIIGRSYAMDRDERWERIRAAYELLTTGTGSGFQDPVAYLTQSYARGISDEHVEPGYRMADDGSALGRIAAGDGIIFFNFREDSMRELVAAFAAEAFAGFPRERLERLTIATMTEYDEAFTGVAAAFRPLEITRPLARVLSEAGKRQLHIAETEKYAHVTYFFNGGTEKPFPDEDRILVPSLAVPHFDLSPEMRVPEITAKIIERLDQYDFILANFANADMVGHTGNFAAVVLAVEALDQAVGQLMAALLERGGVLVVTGDHGNAEEKVHPLSGEAITEHTANPVPFYLIGQAFRRAHPRSLPEIAAAKKETGGILTDIAPTLLDLMRLPQPTEMTGESLLPLLLGERP